jgi:guanylate kinase
MPASPVIVVTGPSGAGKGTLIRRLLDEFPQLEVAISATTRARRPGEEDGREYWFISPAEFQRRIDEGEFLEYVDYVSGKRYGTLRSEIDRIAALGGVCVLELELEGAQRAKRRVAGAVTIFIDAPLDELERRLRERATESDGEIGDRIVLARHQRAMRALFDHVVVNDDVDRATAELVEIVRRELAGTATILA